MMTENFENVNHLVLNFYPDGYSIAVKLNEFPVFTSETILETAKISYEEASLLDFIENEELPPLLVEMIDGSPKLSQYKIWHNGCLILEVRDKISTGTCLDPSRTSKTALNGNSYFILLKPTNLSILNDVLNLTESDSWSTQDKLQLESQIVLHSSPPLSLEPDASKQQNTNRQDTKIRKKLPHTKLNNVCSAKQHTFRNTSMYQSTLDCLPPDFTLQQFLATRRAKKKTFAAGHLAKFHRFKKHSLGNIR